MLGWFMCWLLTARSKQHQFYLEKIFPKTKWLCFHWYEPKDWGTCRSALLSSFLLLCLLLLLFENDAAVVAEEDKPYLLLIPLLEFTTGLYFIYVLTGTYCICCAGELELLLSCMPAASLLDCLWLLTLLLEGLLYFTLMLTECSVRLYYCYCYYYYYVLFCCYY
jgi:hypothetical protein